MSTAKFEVSDTPIVGLKVVQRIPIEDSRGFLCRFFCAEEFSQTGFVKPIRQINHTLTRSRGFARGLHFQYAPAVEAKLISCLKGEVFDVAVDVRHGSPTFLHWHAVRLSSGNHLSYYLPEGFAHGCQALTDDCEMLYLHSENYNPEALGSLNLLDPKIAVEWPLPIAGLSERDKQARFVNGNFKGVVL